MINSPHPLTDLKCEVSRFEDDLLVCCDAEASAAASLKAAQHTRLTPAWLRNEHRAEGGRN